MKEHEREYYHSLHEPYEAPKSYSVVLLDSIDWSKKIAHTLNITQARIILVVSQEHIFHLL